MRIIFTVFVFYFSQAQELQTYSIDRIHSKIGFAIGYAGGVIDAEGRFHQFNGEIRYNHYDRTSLQTEISIDVESIDTGLEFRDKDLRSPNWFNAEKFPKITFKSTSFTKEGSYFKLYGKLTMHGHTKDVVIDVTPTTDQPKLGPGRFYIGFNGSMTLNRQDYKVHTSDPDQSFWKYNDVMQSTGEMFVSDEVRVNLKILGVRSGREIAADLFRSEDLDDAIEAYEDKKDNNTDKLFFSERDMNGFGYQLLNQNKLDDAITVFKENIRLYPQSAAIYDSLADGYLKKNDKSAAKETLEKGIKLAGDNRRFARAKTMMQKKLAEL